MRTRRDFLDAVAVYGGSVTAAIAALDLAPPATAAPFAPRGRGEGRSVVILGAGVGGLCAAYELHKLGYDVQILEARSRPGGRVWTVRNGTSHRELDGTRQTATFADGQYLNPGPARVPPYHVTMQYYRELGVPVEQFGNENSSAYYYSTTAPAGKRRVRIGEAKFAFRGYASELLAKNVTSESLDAPMTADDKDKLLTYLRQFGQLDKLNRYKNEGSAGYRVFPGAFAQPGVPSDPLDLQTLVRGGFGAFLGYEYDLDQQPTMFQPVGGIDALPYAFAKRLEGRISYEAVVTAIRKTPNGVRVVYTDAAGATRAIAADYAICTIPLSVLRGIPADFTPAFNRALHHVDYAPSAKIGLEFKRRFWEEDDHIMGGISRTDLDITQIFYPSYGFLQKRGVLVGYYTYGDVARRIGRMTPAQRQHLALTQGALIHPQYPNEFVSSFSVAWQRVPYNQGAWVQWTEETRKHDYPVLSQPDGRIYLAGEHMSYINGWQAGALESARSVVTAIHRRTQVA
jgi:monoamine oxidase